MNLPSKTLRTVVFDFDGTLALLNIDFQEMRGDILDLAASYGILRDGMDGLFVLEMIEEVRQRIGRTCPGKQEAFSGLALKRVSERELTGAANGCLFPGVKEMLLELRRRGIKTGILTRNCLEAIMRVFPDVRSYCDAVVTREDTPRVKPDPEHMRVVLRRLNENAGLSAMVGDHPMDISVGREVGAFTIGVLTGYSSFEDLHDAGADMILQRASEITKYLE
jgi:phosphoglycolate phosphatase